MLVGKAGNVELQLNVEVHLQSTFTLDISPGQYIRCLYCLMQNLFLLALLCRSAVVDGVFVLTSVPQPSNVEATGAW